MIAALLFLLFFLVASGSFFEYKIYKTVFTPFILFSVPYFAVIMLQLIWIYINNTMPMSIYYLFYYFIFFILILIIGNTYIFVINKVIFQKNFIIKPSMFIVNDNFTFLKYISVFLSIYLLFVFTIHASELNVIGEIVQVNFQNQYSGGINFYFRLIVMIGSIYFFTIAKNKTDILLGLLCLLPNFLTFVKGIAIINILAGLVGHMIYYKKRLRVSLILKLILLGLIIFGLVYIIQISIWNPDKLFSLKTYLIVYNKILTYLISGVQSFNINLHNGYYIYNGDNITIAPLLNMLHKFGLFDTRMETVGPIHTILYDNSILGIVDTTVNSYIGTLLMYGGVINGILLHCVVVLVIYTFFYINLITSNPINKVFYALFVSGFILAWFEYFFIQTFWIYFIIIYICLIFIYHAFYKQRKIKFY